MDAKLAADRPSTPPPPADADPELPGYSAARAQNELVEHQYQLEDLKGRPWLWLKVKSRSISGKQLPLFFDKDTVAGTVEVDFDKAEGAKAILVSVSTSTLRPFTHAILTLHAPLRSPRV